MTPESRQDRRLPTVQALRGIAAVLVVVNHFARIFQDGGSNKSWIYETGFGNLGACGVDVFFVISGFIMVYTTNSKGGMSDAVTFIRRRIARIYPLYWLWTSLLVALWWAGLAKLGGHNHQQHYSGLYLLKSYLLIPASNGENFRPILAQGWTLSFEMFFYFVFSGAIALRLKSQRLTLLIGVFAAFAGIGKLLGPDSGIGYLFTSSIIIEFVYGVIVAELLGRLSLERRQSHSSKMLPVLLMLLGTAALVCTVRVQVTDAWRFIFYGIPSASIVLGAAMMGTREAPHLLTYLGDASYSIYLVHDFFAMGYASALKHFPRVNEMAPDPTIIFATILTVACSSVTYKLVEQPLTRLLSDRKRNRSDIGSQDAGHSVSQEVAQKVI